MTRRARVVAVTLAQLAWPVFSYFWVVVLDFGVLFYSLARGYNVEAMNDPRSTSGSRSRPALRTRDSTTFPED